MGQRADVEEEGVGDPAAGLRADGRGAPCHEAQSLTSQPAGSRSKFKMGGFVSTQFLAALSRASSHPGGNPGANRKSISHRCHPILVAFVWELTKETINLPLG